MRVVLIVDDDPMILILLRSFIRISHPCVAVFDAEHGSHALETISTTGEKFDLIIADTEMPIMGGIELVKKVREEHPHTRIILMSGNGEPEDHGAHAFLAKPFKRGDLLRVVNELMRQP